jgi:hypothetical protein
MFIHPEEQHHSDFLRQLRTTLLRVARAVVRIVHPTVAPSDSRRRVKLADQLVLLLSTRVQVLLANSFPIGVSLLAPSVCRLTPFQGRDPLAFSRETGRGLC